MSKNPRKKRPSRPSCSSKGVRRFGTTRGLAVAITVFFAATILTVPNHVHAWIVDSKLQQKRQLHSRLGSAQAHRDDDDNMNASFLTDEETAATTTPEERSSSSPSSSSSWMDVVASVTQESCPLLGVKSLGVDYGLVRTGLAVTVGYEPQALAIVDTGSITENDNHTTTSQQHVCEQIIRYATAESVQRIVVGLPLHKNGTVAEQTNLTLAFGQVLQRHVVSNFGDTVPVVFFDERYTSKEAAARRGADCRVTSRSSYGTSLDADAACIILENYYNDNGVGAHEYKLLPDNELTECLVSYNAKKLAVQVHQQAILAEREAKLQRRREAMARDALLQQEINNEGSSTKKQKKKRKKKR